MRLIIYIFLACQFLNFLGVFAEKTKENPSKLNSVNWEKVKDSKSSTMKKIIWKSFKNDEFYFEDKNKRGSMTKSTKPSSKERIYESLQKSGFSISEIELIKDRDESISNGGITVNNALLPSAGTIQLNFNYDNKGNLFGLYGYSLSDIFQLEILNIGSFNELNFNKSENANIYSNFLEHKNFNFRFGGKFLIFSPQENNLYWLTLRSSVGTNIDNYKLYIFSEFINTLRVNNWLVLNISPKFFFSGVENFGGIGFSSYINLSDNLLLIPEINTSFKNDSDLNSTLAFRYSFSPDKSLDLYYSNAVGIQDVGQLLKDKEYRFGIKFNYLL